VLEKKGILGNAPGRRPGDVTIPLWEKDRALAMDIAVTSSSRIELSRIMHIEHKIDIAEESQILEYMLAQAHPIYAEFKQQFFDNHCDQLNIWKFWRLFTHAKYD